MSALITKFDSHGQVAKVKSTTFHLVGKGENTAVEVQISQNSTVEISLKEIIEKKYEKDIEEIEKTAKEIVEIMGKR